MVGEVARPHEVEERRHDREGDRQAERKAGDEDREGHHRPSPTRTQSRVRAATSRMPPPTAMAL